MLLLFLYHPSPFGSGSMPTLHNACLWLQHASPMWLKSRVYCNSCRWSCSGCKLINRMSLHKPHSLWEWRQDHLAHIVVDGHVLQPAWHVWYDQLRIWSINGYTGHIPYIPCVPHDSLTHGQVTTALPPGSAL